MDTINNTGVPTKNKGDGLSASDINKINGTVNECVSAINPILKSYFNPNAEGGNFSRVYTESEAIEAVPESRRSIGLIVRYNDVNVGYKEISFIGDSPNTDQWYDLTYWIANKRFIDGGEW